MRFLNPLGLLGLLLAGPIIALYFLRLRRREVRVPSLLLWDAVPADRRANRPWQKLRPNWLLYLQLLILLSLVLALAQPAVPRPLTVHGQVIILLDASASMQARDRFATAVQRVLTLATGLNANDRVSLITVGAEPQIVLSDAVQASLKRTLAEVVPSDGPADWEAAAALAAGLAVGEQLTTLVVTDAAISQPLPQLPGTVRLISVGGDVPNVGIVAFALRASPVGEGREHLTAFVRLYNAGPLTQRVVTLYADGVFVAQQAINLPADATVSLSFPNVSLSAWAEVRLEEEDALRIDNRAWVARTSAENVRVGLVSSGNRFLVQALRALPGITLERAPQYVTDVPGLLVVDAPLNSVMSQTLPLTNLWLIAPSQETLCGVPGGVFTPTLTARGQWTHPLLQYVEWRDVHVAQARHYDVPTDAEILLEVEEGPLLWTLERPEQRVACLAFDLHDSDLPLHLAFPILTSNLVNWLLPRVSLNPFQPLPGGVLWPLPDSVAPSQVLRVAGLPGADAHLSRVGVYRVVMEADSETLEWYVALSLLDQAESDLRPQEVTLEGQPVSFAADTLIGWRTLRPWLIVLALILLLIETYVWWRPLVRGWRWRGPDAAALSIARLDGAGAHEENAPGTGLRALFRNGTGLRALFRNGTGLRALFRNGTGLRALFRNGTGLRALFDVAALSIARLARWFDVAALSIARLARWFGVAALSIARLGEACARVISRVSFPIVLRACLCGCLLLALWGGRWSRRTRDLMVVFVLDRSASTQVFWADAVAFVEAALAQKSPRDRAALVVFGRDAWVERAASTDAQLQTIATLPRADATNLEEAARLARALIPSGAPGRIVLLTDGLETIGQAYPVLQDARALGVAVDVVQMGSGAPGSEAWVVDLRVPARVYPGDRVPVRVEVATLQPQTLRLFWEAAGDVGQQQVRVDERDTFVFTFTAPEQGLTPLRVCLDPASSDGGVADTFSQNNCATGWVIVEGAPRILVVGEEVERAALVSALEHAGLLVEARAPAAMPATVQGLASYASVVLVNMPARHVPPGAQNALHDFVRDFGGGLVATGGPQSYGVGGWLGTPLEDALPVQMQVRDPERFPPLAMGIVIDKSGSMTDDEAGVPKIRLAAEAAVRVAEGLNDADTLAVVAFDDRPADTLGPVQMTERDTLIASLLRLQAGGGGIYVYESLAYIGDLLQDVPLEPGTQRHILLLADGSDAERQEDVPALVSKLRQANVTVSVVAIGEGQDVPFLERVAEMGEGRFYLTQRAGDLPSIFAEETARAKRSYIVETVFYPLVTATWLPLEGIGATPALRGYVAASPKSSARVVWETAQGDPLLAVWNYGLGQSVAWTSDVTGRWAAAWLGWEDFGRFWGAVVRSTLPPPSDAGLTLRVIPEGDLARAQVDVLTPEGGYADGLDLGLYVTYPGTDSRDNGEVQRMLKLWQTAPGRYEATFPTYAQTPVLLRIVGERNFVAGWSPPPPSETIPGDAGRAIARLVSYGAKRIEQPDAVFVHDVRGRETGRSLAPLLVLLVMLLWPVDIAWRRLALSRADWQRLWAKIRGLRPSRKLKPVLEEAPASLAATLRETLTRTHAQRESDARSSASPASSPRVEADSSDTADTHPVPEPHPVSEGDSSLAARLKERMKKRE